MLRCNYIMRGVYLTPGNHTVEFRYHTSLKTLCLSLCGWAAGLFGRRFSAVPATEQAAGRRGTGNGAYIREHPCNLLV